MFGIEILPGAEEDLLWFCKPDQVQIRDAVYEQLRHQPDVETRNRKRLKGRHLAEWELRVGDMRVFYGIDAESGLVTIVAVGYKERNKLFFQGEEYET